MFSEYFFPNFFLRSEKFFVNLSFVLFLVFLAAAIYQEIDNIEDYFASSGLITLLLNIVVVVVAFVLCKIFSIADKQKKTILIETGLQNGTLAIVVTGLIFNDPIYLVPTATYALIMYAIIFTYIIGLKIFSKN